MNKGLAIKGHLTRGKDVIQLLEMLGGVNKHQIGAIRQTYVYFIDTDGIIRLLQIDQLLPEKDIVYSLEEFEEKYPYKVGDKVTLDNKLCSIIWMCWECNNIYYQVQGIGDVFTKKVTADELKLYKERNTEEEKENFAECIEKTIQECLFGKEGATKEIKIDIPEGYEFFGIDDNNKVVLTKIQPQYPKTYEECEASGFSSNPVIVAQAQGVCLCSFAKLIVLRNTYWKIAGEQMGLGKPWKPDLVENCGEYRYCIHNQSNKIELCTINWLGKNYILSFPTAEMRDEFYNNFKELIEECKELL